MLALCRAMAARVADGTLDNFVGAYVQEGSDPAGLPAGIKAHPLYRAPPE